MEAAMNLDQTRARIVASALDEASRRGFDGLSLADLARAAQMSKSGLYAHFGSREALELALVKAIAERFEAVAWRPHQDTEPGAVRLRAIVADWKRWVDGSVFPGGCPIAAVSADLNDRPGPAQQALASSELSWLRTIAREFAATRDSVRVTDLDEQLATELRNNVVGYGYMLRFLQRANASRQLDATVDRLIDMAARDDARATHAHDSDTS
jgi:AcrR family transcriptional regulator